MVSSYELRVYNESTDALLDTVSLSKPTPVDGIVTIGPDASMFTEAPLDAICSGTIYTIGHTESVASATTGRFVRYSGGTLWTWGRNHYGQLGDGTTSPRSSPIQVGSLTTWSQVAAGQTFTTTIFQGSTN
jgi:hypothetical protein